MKYPNLFSPIKVGNVTLKNRIVMPPMDTNSNNMDGSLSRKCFQYLAERARGGVGLIIMEAVSVDWPEGKISERQLSMNSRNITTELHDLAEVVHSYGGKIIPQLHHGGFLAHPEFCNGAESISASDMSSPFPPARAMTVEEIKNMIQKFVNAAKNAQLSGMDGVEIHASHMYLINQFLSPLSNYRTDEYGGSLENRMRILVEIIKGIRAECGYNFLLSVRLGVKDAIPGGVELEEGKEMARICEESGADLINCTTGLYMTLEMMTEGQYQEEGARLFYARAVKPALKNAKVAIVGKFRTPSICEKAIADKDTDLICMGRQLICDPFWPIKAEEGREDEIRSCLNCDEGCLHQFYNMHSNIRCVLNPYVGFEDFYRESDRHEAAKKKNILVVGGGIAGMQAAITSARKGHHVTIMEKADSLGGQMIIAGVPPHKEILHKALKWFVDETGRLGVNVKLSTEADLKAIQAFNPDAVLVAIGSIPSVPPIPSIDKAVDSWKILSDTSLIPSGKKIVVIGGGIVGCETAHLLTEKKNQVTIIEMLPELCRGQEPLHRGLLDEALRNANVQIEINACTLKVDDNNVQYRNAASEVCNAPCDMIVVATGQKTIAADLVRSIKAVGINAYSIGDATATGNLRTATRSAFDVANIL